MKIAYEGGTVSYPRYSQPPPDDPARSSSGSWQPEDIRLDAQFGPSGIPQPNGLMPVGRVMVGMGHIEVTDSEVRTPVGTIPLSAASFTFSDVTSTIRKIPTWAIVCAVAGFFVLTFFSLFFLLAKETVTTGHVVVGVRGGGLDYSEPMPVVSAAQVRDLFARVQYANGLVGQRWA